MIFLDMPECRNRKIKLKTSKLHVLELFLNDFKRVRKIQHVCRIKNTSLPFFPSHFRILAMLICVLVIMKCLYSPSKKIQRSRILRQKIIYLSTNNIICDEISRRFEVGEISSFCIFLTCFKDHFDHFLDSNEFSQKGLKIYIHS